jgi:hypothetical protein
LSTGGTVAHVSHLRWKPDATAVEIERVTAELATLRHQVPGLLYYAFGPDLGLREGNADYAVVGVFADVDAYREYAGHPEHLRILHNVIGPILDARSAAQLPVPWPPT